MKALMGKILCILMSFAIAFVSMPIVCAEDNETQIIETETLFEYADALSEIVEEQKDLKNHDKTNQCSTNRVLIGASDVKSINFDAVSPETILFNEDGDMAVLQFSMDTQAKQCIDYYSNYPGIDYAEMDGIVEIQSLPERIVYSSSENLRNAVLSWGVDSSHVYDYVQNLLMQNIGVEHQVTVAVIDSGIDLTHNYLKDKITSGGYDFAYGDSEPNDADGHGTHVSGIIVDCVGDLNVKILPLKALDDEGRGSNSQIINAIKYATNQKVDVINMSLGGDKGHVFSSSLDNAIKSAISAGIMVCIAAGNEFQNTSGTCPAHMSEPMVISAINVNDNFADFSNYGSSVDFAAPGVNIYNTYIKNSFATLSGTSMATPHVSGFAAVLRARYPKQVYPEFKPSTFEQGMRNLCDDLGPAGRDNYYGYGKINFNNCIFAKAHSEGDWQIFKDSTCTSTGIKIKKCTYCNDITSKDTIAVKAHEYQTIETAPTCTVDGRVAKVCRNCGRTEVLSVTPASHKTGTGKTENYVYPSCTSVGGYDTVYYCTVCGAEVSRTHVSLDKMAHSVVEDKGYEATCTRDGLTDGSHCSVCQTVVVPQTVIPMKEHVYSEKIIENNIEPTCSSEGSYDCVYYCTSCGKELSRTHISVAKTQHTLVNDLGYDATCTSEGLSDGIHCSVCGQILTEPQVIPAFGHQESEWIVTVPATSENEGIRVKKCQICGEIIESESIAKLQDKIVAANDSSVVIDDENSIIYGFTHGINDETSLESYVCAQGNDAKIVFQPSQNGYGTGSVISLVKNGEVMKSYTVVIFGDSNGDGNVDEIDLFLLDLYNSMLYMPEDNSPEFSAMDCTRDGMVDEIDLFTVDMAVGFIGEIDQVNGGINIYKN